MTFEIRFKIKELRKECGLTQKQLAKPVHKSETAVASWEQGVSELCVNDIRKLCEMFKVSAEHLLGLEN